MNKLPWFTHDHDAHMDQWLRDGIRAHGHQFHTFYWTALELIHWHGVGGILKINIKDLSNSMQIRTTKLLVILRSSQAGCKFGVTISEDHVEMKNEKFIERQRKMKSNAPSMLYQCSINAPIEEEEEGEKEREKETSGDATVPVDHGGGDFSERILAAYVQLKGIDPTAPGWLEVGARRYKRASKRLLKVMNGNAEVALEYLNERSRYLNSKGLFEWTLETIVKNAGDHSATQITSNRSDPYFTPEESKKIIETMYTKLKPERTIQ